MKHTWKKAAAGLLAMALVVGAVPVNVGTGGLFGGTAITAYAATSISGTNIAVFDSDSGTLSNDMTCTSFNVLDSGTLTINQGVTLTLNCQRFTFMDSSTIELHGTLTGSAGSRATWMDRSYINVYLSDGAKYTVTGLSCEDGDSYLVYYGYDAATDGNGTVSVKNGDADVTSASKGYKATSYTFTATPNDGYKFVNWTKGAGGEVLGTDASINVTCEQNGQYQVYANFEEDVAKTDISTAAVTLDTDNKVSAVTLGETTIDSAEYDVIYGATAETASADFPTAPGKYYAFVTAKADSTSYTGTAKSEQFVVNGTLANGEYKQTATKTEGDTTTYYTRFVFVKPLSELDDKSKAVFTLDYDGRTGDKPTVEKTEYYTGMTSNGISYTPESEDSVLLVVTVSSGRELQNLKCELSFE